MDDGPRITGGRGVRVLNDGWARLPSGERVLLERELQTSARPPMYAADGKLRVMEAMGERLLVPGPRGRAMPDPPATPTPTPTPTPPLTPPPTPPPTPSPSPTPTPTPSLTPPNTPPPPASGEAPLNEPWTPDWI